MWVNLRLTPRLEAVCAVRKSVAVNVFQERPKKGFPAVRLISFGMPKNSVMFS